MPSLSRGETSAAQKYVDRLLAEGSEVSCDETNANFFGNNELPPFYDEELFKRGQRVFDKHIFAMMFAKIQGLLAVLLIPTIRRMLVFTKMSGSDLMAYKRYLATTFHMVVWYQNDFKPGSKLWNSISEVRNMHNSASKRGCEANISRISQKDMALTQFGFMGFALARAEKVGIYGVTEEEWAGFLHVWRVVGYLMGMEDRFNLCTGSVKETKEICNILMDQVFRPEIKNKDQDFLSMSRYLLRGMWALNPAIGVDCFLIYLYALIQNDNVNFFPVLEYQKLGSAQKFHLHFLQLSMFLLQFDGFRIFEKYVMYMSLWLMKVFPFLAFYMFGRSNSYVKIKC
ncbi:uncharacterized protein [Leptinotarsa decemlineata]|uniref:uncharacterized protein n=1 Tax=Leptinotarsa decemlineata TaxID=7539 RepID=UPI003D30A1E0